jgi:Holliday junction resolvase
MKTIGIYRMLILIYFSCIAIFTFGTNVSNEIRDKTIAWNKLNNHYDEAQLAKLVMPTVFAYGEQQTRAEYLAMKRNFLKRQKSFSQSIISPLSLSFYKASFIKCSFSKQATFNGKTKNYPAYLIFQEQDGHYLISGESDEVTDVNLGYNAHLPQPEEVRLVALNEEEQGVNWLYVFLGLMTVVGIGVFVFFFFKKKPTAPPVVVVQSNVPEIENTTAVQTEWSNKEKGDAFEKYIVRCFDEERFKIIEWQSDKGIDGRYPEANMKPDLIFALMLQEGNVKFAVECKYRSQIDKSKLIEICSSDQLDRYKTFARREKMEVFLALGVGGTPDCPDEVYAIPLRNVYHAKVEFKKIEKYFKQPGRRFFYSAYDRMLT